MPQGAFLPVYRLAGTNRHHRTSLMHLQLWALVSRHLQGAGGAQAGAAHVYAVEMSGIAEQARQIVADNGYSDRITLLQAKVEEITLPVDKARLAPGLPGSAGRDRVG
jgi:hypothetical protein